MPECSLCDQYSSYLVGQLPVSQGTLNLAVGAICRDCLESKMWWIKCAGIRFGKQISASKLCNLKNKIRQIASDVNTEPNKLL